jgi:THO complex subunit 3
LDPTQPTPIASYKRDIEINQIAFDWSGAKLYLSTGGGRVEFLNFPAMTPAFGTRAWEDKPFSLNGHTSACLSVALQPTARYLATGGSDSIIALFDTKYWICQRTLIDMVGPVRSISFSFDGSYIVGGSDEGSGLEIAHVETGEYVHSIKTADPCPVVAWHPSKYHLAYADKKGLNIVGVDPDRK